MYSRLHDFACSALHSLAFWDCLVEWLVSHFLAFLFPHLVCIGGGQFLVYDFLGFGIFGEVAWSIFACFPVVIQMDGIYRCVACGLRRLIPFKSLWLALQGIGFIHISSSAGSHSCILSTYLT
jgi:hypothetical protein